MKKRTGNPLPAPTVRSGRRLQAVQQIRPGKKAILALLSIGLLTLLPLSAAAKKKPPLTKTISGAVLDSSNHGVTGASVMLTDSETHRTTAIYSGAKGFYSFSGLDPNHNYQVQAKYKSMVSDRRGVSAFDGRVHMVVNLVLNSPDAASASNPQ